MHHPSRNGQAALAALFLVAVAAHACSSSDAGVNFPAGAKCTQASDCGSHVCLAGTCQGSASSGGASSGGGAPSGGAAGRSAPSGSLPGSPCTQASECSSGKCTGALCQPSGMLPNTTCTTGADCASGICTSGKCEIPAGTTGSGGNGRAGSLGCRCQSEQKCQDGLSCMSGTCCDSRTKSCSPQMRGGGTGGAGGSGNPPGTKGCAPGVVGPVITECGYPYSSSNALTNVAFNESSVLAAIVPSGGYPFASIQLFYTDEHAMTLGVGETVINGVSTKYTVSPLPGSPGVVDNPKTGTNQITGQQAGVDLSGRPMWPALFITDITNDPNAVGGDWQWGGSAVNPSHVAGTWKGAVRTVDSSGASITPDADPAKNNLNLGNGDMVPNGAIPNPEGFTAEVRWDVRLEVGHNYRFQVMVHDGDQTKVGGDSGEACITFCAGNECPAGYAKCSTDPDCSNGYTCVGGCCVPPPPPPPMTDGGTCPPNWQQYVQTEGRSICTPPPMNGECPAGYVITIQNNQQYCTPVQIR